MAAADRKATELKPSIPELWMKLGIMRRLRGEHFEMIRSTRQTIKIDSTHGIEYKTANQTSLARPRKLCFAVVITVCCAHWSI